MCAGCLTSAEALVITGGGALVAAKAGLARMHDRLIGRAGGVRAVEAYDANASFLAEMGHDPEMLLGERPDVTPEPERAAASVVGLAWATGH